MPPLVVGVYPYNEASMKAPPKRKGNVVCGFVEACAGGLNESPSEKEGKYIRCSLE